MKETAHPSGCWLRAVARRCVGSRSDRPLPGNKKL